MAYKDFQQNVGRYFAPGLPGQPANIDSIVTTAINYVSDGTIEAGTFAFADASPAEDATVNFVSKTKSGGRLIGFVLRSFTGTLNVPYANNSLAYAKGANLTICRRGQVLAEVPSGQSPTIGQAVLCDPATGNVTYGTRGAANDTGWTVLFLQGKSSATEGDLVIYENLGADPTITG